MITDAALSWQFGSNGRLNVRFRNTVDECKWWVLLGLSEVCPSALTRHTGEVWRQASDNSQPLHSPTCVGFRVSNNIARADCPVRDLATQPNAIPIRAML
jgi:hypothetical protein